MKEMTAKEYLKTIAKICDFEESAGRCYAGCSKPASAPVCPLEKYSCGTPKDPKDIEAVLEIVAKYKTPPKGTCRMCGADLKELRETQKIKYCPFCGEELRNFK